MGQETLKGNLQRVEEKQGEGIKQAGKKRGMLLKGQRSKAQNKICRLQRIGEKRKALDQFIKLSIKLISFISYCPLILNIREC